MCVRVCVWGGLSTLIILILTYFVQITLRALGLETKAKHLGPPLFFTLFHPFLEVTTEGLVVPWGRGGGHLTWGSSGKAREQTHC